ncbi:MAG: class I SAM-dependent methyltransferase [Oscillospiraceae bacterium]|nr:class I SAM-dependent methyltransferase [Oscillospiraceae bacterium]
MTGWERDRRTHFDEIAADYDKMRSEYPGELFDDIFEYSGMGKRKKALEIGAGTGKATTPFLDAGCDVTAVEIGANMAAFLLERYKNYKDFNVITADFESALLEEGCYDLIYAASAFHWVDADIGCPKVFRLLKSGGTFALFRYNAIAACGEDCYEDIQAVYEKHYYSYFPSNVRPVRKSKADFEKPSEIHHSFGFEDLKQYGFTGISMMFYDTARTFGADEYIAWLDTMSDHRSMPESGRAALYEGIRESIIRHGGHHKVDFIYKLYMGRKP